MPAEDTALLPAQAEKKHKSTPLSIKLISNGLSTTAQAFNTTANAQEFTKEFGRSNVATATTTAQSVFRNVPGGALLAPGQIIAGILGKNYTPAHESSLTDEQKRQIRDAMVTGYTLAAFYTVLTSFAYLGCYFVLPDVYGERTGKDASYYLLTSGISTWPILALTVLNSVVFSANHWLASMVSALASRSASIGLSYLFSDETALKILGIGVGNAAGPIPIYLFFEWWMRRQPDLQMLRFNKIGEEEQTTAYTTLFKKIIVENFKKQLILSLKIGSQRAAEWVNLWVIALLIGRMLDDNLTAANPSTQLLSILNLFSQGIGIGTNLILKSYVASVKNTELPLEDRQASFEKIKRTSKKSFVYPFSAYVVIAGLIAWQRANIVSVFLSGEEATQLRPLAEKLLLINACSLPVDAIRLITSGSLNAFDKLVNQNLWSIFWMTVVGVTAPYFATEGKDNDFRMTMIFIARVITIAISAAINLYMEHKAIQAIEPKAEESSINTTRIVEIPVGDEERKPTSTRSNKSHLEGVTGLFSPRTPRRSACTPVDENITEATTEMTLSGRREAK